MSATVFYASVSELATLTNTFAVAGVATDPTTVSLVVTDPNGAATTYTYAGATITKSATGVYTKDIPCTIDGLWSYVWTGTGAASDVTAGTWTVLSTELSKLYCSADEIKSRFGLAATDTADDFEIRLAVEAASRWIDGHCHRYFWRGTDTRTYVPESLYRITVDDLVSVTTLKTDASGDGTFETTWASTDYQLLPANPGSGGLTRPYTKIGAVGTQWFPSGFMSFARDDRVQIVGVFGWPAVPSAVKQAALILSADTFKSKDSPFGVAGFGDFAIRVRDNPRVAALLAPYRRSPIMVA